MSDTGLTHQVLRIHLSSWRYMAVLTLPSLVVVFQLLYSYQSMLLLLLFCLAHYYCWRLWLDERLFALLHHESDLSAFDEAMSVMWPQQSLKAKTLDSRWAGTRKLFYRAVSLLLMLWLAVLGCIWQQIH